MRVAALVMGILAGLSTFPLASYAYAFLALGGANRGVVIYLLPVAMFVGGGLALNAPGAACLFLLGGAGTLLFIGSNFGYAINFITIGPVVLSGLGGLLALGAAFNPPGKEGVRIDKREAGSSTPSAPAFQPQASHSGYDRAKWQALVKYDPEIQRVAQQIGQLGDKWIDVLAADYLSLNDKSYLPQIIRKILNDAKEERRRQEEAEEAAKRVVAATAEERRIRDEEWARRVSAWKESALARWGIFCAVWGVVIAEAGYFGWRYLEQNSEVELEPGTYVEARATCQNASNSVLLEFDGKKFFHARFCPASVEGLSGDRLVITRQCSEDGTNYASQTDTFIIQSPTEFVLQNGFGEFHYRFCEQGDLPEMWRSNPSSADTSRH
ncbi:hypothetical protein [Bradyrhizobium sp. SZCCHNR1075]|uniref:hypothetical protein n=1 Tax=Bradyrhizobium sp. SZCCHNR1075 TaxID=3057362 RepID=UPI0028E21164|nr:hypothetical protein [Bradyrhizobium sp. SZCCHNR1075]